MKKIFLFLLLFLFAVSSYAAAPAGGGLRVDLIAEHRITEASADEAVHVGRRERFGKRKGSGERFEIHDIFYTRGNMSGEWEKMVISFTPEKDERVALYFKGISTGMKKVYPVVHVDALTITGAELQNTDFEVLAKNGAIKGWSGKKENVCTKSPKSGKICARVSYDKYLYQNVKVKKGVPVTITFYTRQEKPLTSGRGADGMTNIYTDNASGTQVHISSGRLLLVPTFENCSYYINRKKTEWNKKCSLKVFYRKKGTSKWNEAIRCVDMEREKAWRGSIMLLEEDTVYEFKGVVSGEAKDEIRSEFRTRSSKFKVAETIVLDSSNFKGQLTNVKSGTPEGYILYKSAPGFVLKGNSKMGGGVIDCSKVKYVIFEGLTIDANGSRHGIKLADCDDIVIRNCDISNFGRCDRIRDMRQQGRWTYKGHQTGWDGGIILHGGKRQLIERCYIHAPFSSSNSWFYSHPTGPEAIFIDKVKGGTVIRYNDLIGSDSRRWNDAIESSGNGAIDGGLGRDADVYGNFFAFSNDDSIEMEGGEMNVRFYYNRVQGSYCGVSTGCCRLGPSYQFRNVYYRLGDENNRCGIHFKNGMGNQGDGAIFIFNNSTWGAGNGFGNFHAKDPVYNPPLKAFTRNNIVMAQGTYINKEWSKWNCDLDNDLFYGADKETEEKFKMLLKTWKQEKNILFTDPLYNDPANGDLRLKKNSPARNRAMAIPGFNMKHNGAFQDDGIEIPFRPVALSLDRDVINFNPGNRNAKFHFTLKSGSYSGAFKVRCNDDFFTVTPAEGRIAANSRITFTVKLNNSALKMPRLYNGMCLVRFADGFSKGVTVYADFRKDEKLVSAAEKHAVMVKDMKSAGKGKYTGKVTIPEKGCYFLFATGKVSGWARTSLKVGDFKTNKEARFISRVPGVAVLRRGHLSGYYLFLDKGTFDVTFSTDMADAALDKMFFTKEPEYFLR